MELTLTRAVENAIEAEMAAHRFYKYLLECTDDPDARQFFRKMANEELEHAENVQNIGRRFTDRPLPDPDGSFEQVEISRLWERADNITFRQALDLAIEGESHARFFYDAVAQSLEGNLADFFHRLAEQERAHENHLREYRLVTFGVGDLPDHLLDRLERLAKRNENAEVAEIREMAHLAFLLVKAHRGRK